MGTKHVFISRHFCRGQALMELAVGMFALSLVIAALITFTFYIIYSLDMQRTVRREAGVRAIQTSGNGFSSSSKNDSIEVDSLAAEYIFGKEKISISEKVQMPAMSILLQE